MRPGRRRRRSSRWRRTRAGRAQRDARSAGQRREVDDQLRLVLGRPGQRVGKDQAPLGVGVVDLDEHALARLDDVAGPIGVRRTRHFRPPGISRCSRTGSRSPMISRASARACAAPPMSFFMRRMPLGRLEVEAAAVEAHALADDRDAGMVRLAPFELDQARRAVGRGRAADCGDQRIACREIVAAGDPELRSAVGSELSRSLFELRRAEIGGGAC